MIRAVRAVAICICLFALAASGEELLVFAAASTAEPVREAGRVFTAKIGIGVKVSLGGSSDLARQIQAGAPADVFLSADLAKMDELEKAGKVLHADRVILLTNHLVVIVPADSALRIAGAEELKGVRRLALADPAAVPAGLYARTWLESVGAWTAIAPKVVPTLDVRAALAAVESGNLDAGIVYRTDAASSRRVRIAFEVPDRQSPKIVYPVASVAGSRKEKAARAFVELLKSEEGQRIFEQAGFGTLAQPRRQ